MNIIFFGKIVAVSLVSLSIPVIGFFVVDALYDRGVEAYGFIESKVVVSSSVSAVSQSDSLQGSSGKDKTSLQCQIKGQVKKFECEVQVIEKLIKDQDSKNNIKWSELSGWKTLTSTITLESEKFYKINTFSSKFDETQLADIEVFKEDLSNKLGTIKTMFIVKNNQIIQGKTSIFVGQASSVNKTISIKDYKCSWGSSSAEFKACKIYPFADESQSTPEQKADTEMSLLLFKHTTTAITMPSKIKEYHYYLIEFTDDVDDSKELASFDLTDLIYAKDSTTTEDDQVTFRKISSVKRVEQQLLILKPNS